MRKYYRGRWYLLPDPIYAGGGRWRLPSGPIRADVAGPIVASSPPLYGPDPETLAEQAINRYRSGLPRCRLPGLIRPPRRSYGYGVDIDVDMLDPRSLRLRDLTSGLCFTLLLVGMDIVSADVFGYEAVCCSALAVPAWEAQERWALSWCARWLDAQRRMKNRGARSGNAQRVSIEFSMS